MTMAMDAALRDALTPHLPAPNVAARFGEQWGSSDQGWQVTRTVRGVDVWTRPVDELSEDQAEACGLAMLAAAARGRAVFGGLDQAVAPMRLVNRGTR